MELKATRDVSQSLWLQPGTIFDGHQYSTGDTSLSSEHSTYNIVGSRQSSISTSFMRSLNVPLTSTQTRTPEQSRIQDNSRIQNEWPVRVKIYECDSDKMVVRGVLKAYESRTCHARSIAIPQTAETVKTHESETFKTSSTYFQGHIVDFDRHSFLTAVSSSSAAQRTSSAEVCTDPNLGIDVRFPSVSMTTDMQNWFHLPPFEDLSKRRCENFSIALFTDGYVLMRWKETCFIRESTLSGGDGPRSLGSNDRRGPSHRVTPSTSALIAGQTREAQRRFQRNARWPHRSRSES